MFAHTLLYSLVLCLFWAATLKTLISASCHHMRLTCLIYCCQCAIPVYKMKQEMKWAHIFFSVAGNIMSYPLNDLCCLTEKREGNGIRTALRWSLWEDECWHAYQQLVLAGTDMGHNNTLQRFIDMQCWRTVQPNTHTFVRKLRWWTVSSV